jgi:hypothetical protein
VPADDPVAAFFIPENGLILSPLSIVWVGVVGNSRIK